MEYFASDRSGDVTLSGREIATLDAIRRQGETGICAADVQVAISKASGREPRVATLYSTILRLEDRGLIESKSSTMADNGGRPRRLFTVTKRGYVALQLVDVLAGAGETLVAA